MCLPRDVLLLGLVILIGTDAPVSCTTAPALESEPGDHNREHGIGIEAAAVGNSEIALDAPHISELTMLLPPPWFGRVEAPVVGYNGCFSWTSLNEGLVQVAAEHNDTEGCSTSARVWSVGEFRGRRSTHVIAHELSTGLRMRLEVFVDKVESLEIRHQTLKVYVEHMSQLQIRGFDAEHNTFTSLEGIQFKWGLAATASAVKGARSALRFVPLRSTTFKSSEVRLKQEHADGLRASDLRIVTGVAVGRQSVSAELLLASGESTGIQASISLLVMDHVAIWPAPSPLRILPGSEIPFRLQHVLLNNSVVWLPASHAQHFSWRVSDSAVATINARSGLLVGRALGTVEVFAEDGRVAGAGDAALVYVVAARSLHLEASYARKPQVQVSSGPQDWPLVAGRRYKLEAAATDAQGHKVLLTKGTNIRLQLGLKAAPSLWSSTAAPDDLLTGMHHLTMSPNTTGHAPVRALLQWPHPNTDNAAANETLSVTQVVSVVRQLSLPALQYSAASESGPASDTAEVDGSVDDMASDVARLRLPAYPEGLMQTYVFAPRGGGAPVSAPNGTRASFLVTSASSRVAAVPDVAPGPHPNPTVLAMRRGTASLHVMAAHDLYPGHNQREVQAMVSSPARAVGGGDIFLEQESQTMLQVVLHNANGEWFHNCTAIHNLPEVEWEVQSGHGAGISASRQTGAAGKHLLLTHGMEARELAPGVCAAAHVTALQPIPLPSTITASVLVDSTPLRTQWQVHVFPHLRAVLKACQDAEAAVPVSLWEFVKTGEAMQTLLVTPGSASCLQLVGGPAEGSEADDHTSVAGPSGGLRVYRLLQRGDRVVDVRCEQEGEYTVRFTSRRRSPDDNAESRAVATTSVAVRCELPAAVKLDLTSDLKEATETAQTLGDGQEVHKVEAAPLIEIAAVFTDSAGSVFTNASGMALSWQVSLGNATLHFTPPATGSLLLQSTLQQVYAVHQDVMVGANERRVQVHVQAARANQEDAEVAMRLASRITLHLVPPITLVPPALAFWAGQTNASQELVHVLGGSRRTALGPVTGDAVPLIQAQLTTGAAASKACVVSTNQTTSRVVVALEGKLLTSTLPRRDAQTAHEAALAAARNVLKQEGMVRGQFKVSDQGTGAVISALVVVAKAARVKLILPQPPTVAVGSTITGALEVLAPDGTPFPAHQMMLMGPVLHLHNSLLRARVPHFALVPPANCPFPQQHTVQFKLEGLSPGVAELHGSVLQGFGSREHVASSPVHVTVYAPLVLSPALLILHPGEDYFVVWSGGPGGQAVTVQFWSEHERVVALETPSRSTVRALSPGTAVVHARANGPAGEDYGTAQLEVRVVSVKSLAVQAPARIVAGQVALATAAAAPVTGHSLLGFGQVCTHYQWTTDKPAVLDVGARLDSSFQRGMDSGFAASLHAHLPHNRAPTRVSIKVTAVCRGTSAADSPLTVQGNLWVWVVPPALSLGCASCRWLLPPRHTTAPGVLPPTLSTGKSASSGYRVLAATPKDRTLVEVDTQGAIVTGDGSGSGCIVATYGDAAAYPMDEDVLACVHVAEVAHLRFWPPSKNSAKCSANEAPSLDELGLQALKLTQQGPASEVAVCVAALSAAGEVFGGAAGAPKVELALDAENNHRDVVAVQVDAGGSRLLLRAVHAGEAILRVHVGQASGPASALHAAAGYLVVRVAGPGDARGLPSALPTPPAPPAPATPTAPTTAMVVPRQARLAVGASVVFAFVAPTEAGALGTLQHGLVRARGTWSCDDSRVAAVDSVTGRAVAVGVGSTLVRFTPPGYPEEASVSTWYQAQVTVGKGEKLELVVPSGVEALQRSSHTSTHVFVIELKDAQEELLLVPEGAFVCTVTPQRVASARVVYQPVPACEVEILGESEFLYSSSPVQVEVSVMYEASGVNKRVVLPVFSGFGLASQTPDSVELSSSNKSTDVYLVGNLTSVEPQWNLTNAIQVIKMKAFSHGELDHQHFVIAALPNRTLPTEPFSDVVHFVSISTGQIVDVKVTFGPPAHTSWELPPAISIVLACLAVVVGTIALCCYNDRDPPRSNQMPPPTSNTQNPSTPINNNNVNTSSGAAAYTPGSYPSQSRMRFSPSPQSPFQAYSGPHGAHTPGSSSGKTPAANSKHRSPQNDPSFGSPISPYPRVGLMFTERR